MRCFKSLHVKTKPVKGAKKYEHIERKTYESQNRPYRRNNCNRPTYQTAKLIEEYYPFVEEAMKEALRLIIKDIKEERRNHENN